MSVDASGAVALLLLAAGLGLVVVVSAWLRSRRSGRGPAKGGPDPSSAYPHLLLPDPPPMERREPMPAWANWVGRLTVLLVLVAVVIAIRATSDRSDLETAVAAPRPQAVRTVSAMEPVVRDTGLIADTGSLVAEGDSASDMAPSGALDDVERLTVEGVVREPAPNSPEADVAEPAPRPAPEARRAPEPEPDGADAGATADREPATEAAVAVRSNTMAAGGLLTCRLREGAPECWGAAPAIRRGEDALRAVRAGLYDICGVTGGGSVECWSSQPDRGFGTGPRPLPGPAVDVTVGADHACAILSDGRVFCWGSNERGQLGGGNLLERSMDPIAVGGLPAVSQISAGWHHTCALTPAGQAYCWGANGGGQLGDGSSEDRSRPVRVSARARFGRLAAGSSHTCGLERDGTAWCWGDNGRGQLGVGGEAPGPAPVEADLAFVSLTAGGTHSCALTEGGEAWCWGGNTYGQLGNGTLVDAPAPLRVSAGPIRFAEVAAGGAHTCGRSTQGPLYCWGNNLNGQLGDGTRDNRLQPVEAR
jgi:hypothetical protein